MRGLGSGTVALVLAMSVWGCDDTVGTISTGGTGGAAGTGGMAGTGGTGGVAGTGGAAGTGGMGGMVDPCMPNPCMNGATCMNTGGSATCDCAGTGYMGPTCETDVDECDGGLGPCDAIGASACTNMPGTYECTCNAGYEGMNCETDIDECMGGLGMCDPNGASACIDMVNTYECTCNTGYEGMNCDECSTRYEKQGELCVLRCTPTPGVDVSLLSSIPNDVDSLENLAAGLRITAGDPLEQVAQRSNGTGTVQANETPDLRAGDALVFEFLEEDGGAFTVPSTVSNLVVTMNRGATTPAELDAIDFDGNPIGMTMTDMSGFDPFNVSALFSGTPIRRLTLTVPSGVATVTRLQYDHDCL